MAARITLVVATSGAFLLGAAACSSFNAAAVPPEGAADAVAADATTPDDANDASPETDADAATDCISFANDGGLDRFVPHGKVGATPMGPRLDLSDSNQYLYASFSTSTPFTVSRTDLTLIVEQGTDFQPDGSYEDLLLTWYGNPKQGPQPPQAVMVFSSGGVFSSLDFFDARGTRTTATAPSVPSVTSIHAVLVTNWSTGEETASYGNGQGTIPAADGGTGAAGPSPTFTVQVGGSAGSGKSSPPPPTNVTVSSVCVTLR